MDVREEVRRLARPLAEDDDFELVDVEFHVQGRERIVRVLLDRPGGIVISDCARFSRRLSDCLDMNQTVPGGYQLEVSSPGIDRPLRSIEAVSRFVGQRAALTTRDAHDGRRNFVGELLVPSDDGRAGLRTEDGIEHWFEWADVKDARLVVDPWALLRRDGGKR
ncbi:MAG: ribosome maturation factor RimP [Candidatus Eisenbacteria bacterium]|uniref:Ribosome maturation factor RimP n=1 Tax=Eiseniibacteriota bacterium TaxID=2212470 RepID=A0A849SHJ8_UNCEI|nr:ribosome maturation factor RimP [Candidatus Eisenbacteria bacterium]